MTAEIKLANLSSRKYFPVTVACILFSHLNAILKYFLNYATPQNILFHIPELKDIPVLFKLRLGTLPEID